jgi:BirA family biotin operon repressor/biotin-[acetyl-CoA-carboxylase] ligase
VSTSFTKELSGIKGFWYKELDSTMDEAKRLVESGQINNTAFVVADYQSDGRGNYGRKWDSPKEAGIYLSIIHLSESDNPFILSNLYTKACVVACVESINELFSLKTFIKPLNDIYHNGKKLGGILVESKLVKDGISVLITGIGINICKSAYILDRDLVQPVSLEELIDKNSFTMISREKLIESIIKKTNEWYSKIFSGDNLQVQSKWHEYCVIG